jgi:hypothetical protein
VLPFQNAMPHNEVSVGEPSLAATACQYLDLILTSDTGTGTVSTPQSKSQTQGTLRRVGLGLCRYSTSGVYFAHLDIHGKLFRESLRTTDAETAKRKVDAKLGKTTLAHLAMRYVETSGSDVSAIYNAGAQ